MAPLPPGQITVPADLDHLGRVLTMVLDYARSAGLEPVPAVGLEVAAEEVFVNIVNYAYDGGAGEVEVTCRQEPPGFLEIQFRDRGRRFNPLQKTPPATTTDVEHRQVGGMGIPLVRAFADQVDYHHRDGCNILTLRKRINP